MAITGDGTTRVGIIGDGAGIVVDGTAGIIGGGTARIIGDRIRGTSGNGTPGIDGTGGIAGNRIAERLAARAPH
jgi:hypothetical protein